MSSALLSSDVIDFAMLPAQMSCDLEETNESLRCWEKISSYIRILDLSYVLSC